MSWRLTASLLLCLNIRKDTGGASTLAMKAEQRQCLSHEGSGNTQSKGSTLAMKAVETHRAQAVPSPCRQWKHTEQRQS